MPVIGERQYFIDEVGRFHHLLTERSFWKTPGRKEAAIKALGHLYLLTDGLQDGDDSYFRGAIEHCARREYLMITMGMSPAPPPEPPGPEERP